MKKVTIIALVISIIYCGLSVLVFLDHIYNVNSTIPFSESGFYYPGYFLSLALGFGGGMSFVIIGQIITFFLLFYILKTVFNWIAFELKKKKN